MTNNQEFDLFQLQRELESQSITDGIERYRRSLTTSTKHKDGSLSTVQKAVSETTPGLVVMKAALLPVADAINRRLAEAAAGKANRSATYMKFLKFLDAEAIAYIGLSQVLGGFGQPLTTVAFRIASTLEDEMNVQAFREGYGKDEGDREGLLKYFLEKHKDKSSGRNKAIGILRDIAGKRQANGARLGRFLKTGEVRLTDGFQAIAWDENTKVQLGTLIVECVLSVQGMAQVVMKAESKHGAVSTTRVIEPTQELLTKVEEMNSVFESLRPVTAPMIVPPKDWDASLSGGYLTRRIPLIKGAHQNYLKDAIEGGRLDTVFTALNTLQRTPMRVNQRVLEVMDEFWRADIALAGLPKRAPKALPKKPAGALGREKEFAKENPEAWSNWRREAAEVHAANQDGERLTKIHDVEMTYQMAKQYGAFEQFYFVWQMDFRGRAYPVSTHLSPQGNDVCHGLMEFAEGQPLDAQSAVWLAIQGANAWALSSDKDPWMLPYKRGEEKSPGLDKTTFDARYAWVMDHEQQIRDTVRNPLDNTWWTQADAPWQFLSWCFAWTDWLEGGEGTVSNFICYADGSCNGLQHYAALLRNEEEGEAVNLVGKGAPADIYMRVADALTPVVQRDAAQGENCMLARLFLGKTDRKLVKRPVMTTPYGVTFQGIKDQLLSEKKELFLGFEKPLRKPALKYISLAIKNAIGEVVSSATIGMQFLQQVAAVAAESDVPLSWTTPDGFPVMQSYQTYKMVRVRTTVAGGMQVKQDAAGLIRAAIERAITRMHNAETAWDALAYLSLAVIREAAEEGNLEEILREQLTGSLPTADIEKVVATALKEAAKFLEESEETDESGRVVVSTQLRQPTGQLNKGKQSLAIGPNYVHSLDACHLRLTLAAYSDLGLKNFTAVHDSYGVHASNFEVMSRLLRETFVEMHDLPLLELFRDEVGQVVSEKLQAALPEVPEMGTLDLQEVLKSDYFFS